MSPVDKSGGGEGLNSQALTPEQALARFDAYKNNQFYPTFKSLFENMFKSSTPLRVFNKDNRLSDLLLNLITEDKDPMVDKASGLVFDPFAHELLRASLYALYKNLPIGKMTEVFDQSDKLAELYTFEGMGYHWTGARRMPYMKGKFTLPIGHSVYQPDRFDKEAWKLILGPEED